MAIYEQLFGLYGLTVAQVLLTRSDLVDRRRYLNSRNTLAALLAQRIIPVINENDTVATEEIRVGDNDNLSALVANLVEADWLILLTDQPGLFTADPRQDPAAAAEFEEAINAFSRVQWDEAFGSSGTVGAVAEILRAEGWSDGRITADGLQKLRHALLDAGEIRRIKFAGMKPDRQEVLAGGVAVLSAVFETLCIDEMRPARGALRVGVLYDLLGRKEHRDLRDATVERMLDRFGVDRAQAARGAAIAEQLYAGLRPIATAEMRKRLAWSALLHEVGFAISHSDYHKHSAYLVQHADLAGFSTSDQERIAQLLLGQRGNLKKVYDALEDREHALQILILRLAVILNHARRDIARPQWLLKFGREIEFGIESDWLARHPLTHYLLERTWAQFDEALDALTLAPFGNGLGTEQVGRSAYSVGSLSNTTFESQLPRIILELGLFGLAGILIVSLGAVAALQSVKRHCADDNQRAVILATQLFLIVSFLSNIIFNHVASAFAWIIFTAVMAALPGES